MEPIPKEMTMKTRKGLMLLLPVLFVAGCTAMSTTITKTTKKLNGDVVTVVTKKQTDYAAQVEATQALNSSERKPIFKLTAAPGVPITGLSSLEVYGDQKQIDIPSAPQSAAAQIGLKALDVVKDVATAGIIGSVAKNVSNNMREAGTAGYAYVQAPGATTINGTGVVGGGSANSVGGTGAAGGNYTDAHPVTTTTTDNHAADSHAVTSTTNNYPAPASAVQ
jgi:hypothetical protein